MESAEILFLLVFGILLFYTVVRNLTGTQKSDGTQTVSSDDLNNETLRQQNLVNGQENLATDFSSQDALQMHINLNNDIHNIHVDQHHFDQHQHNFENQNNFRNTDATNASTINCDNTGFSDSANF